jgi:hypothetical protein
MSIAHAAYVLGVIGVHAPSLPHAVIGVLGDGSQGVMRLQFTEPATVAEVMRVVDILTDHLPLPVYVETVWTPRGEASS